MTSRQEHLTGRVSVVDDEQLARMSTGLDIPYPLGLPRRVADGIRKTMEKFAQSVDDTLGLNKVHEVTNLMPSDVPGVLIAAGLDEILASLGRIQRANGFEASDRAYRALLARALADGRDDIAQAMTSVREQLVRNREQEKRDSSTKVRDLMQQKADDAQRNAQKAKEFAEQREAALTEYQKSSQQIAGVGLGQPLGFRGSINFGKH